MYISSSVIEFELTNILQDVSFIPTCVIEFELTDILQYVSLHFQLYD